MKNIIIVASMCFHLCVYGQYDIHTLDLTLSNNGQIDDVVSPFYWFGAYGPNYDTYAFKRKKYKLNLNYEILNIG